MPDKIYEESFTEAAEDVEAYADLVAIVRQLRRDCPWDRQQTHESVKPLLIEETYEVIEAIDRGNPAELRAELGDLLLHVLFHSAIAEGTNAFTVRDVIDTITSKLVRRHPHVFGDVEVAGTDEVLANWEQIKLEEGEGRSALDGVPPRLPALLRAYRIQEKAAGVGFDFVVPDDAWGKVREEIDEFRSLVKSQAAPEQVRLEFGDLLFSLVNYARYEGIDPEDALRRTNDKFICRFKYIEEQLAAAGSSVRSANLEEMDALWEESKTTGGAP